ncbi:MAG: DUF3108 domain-containing protein [Pseudomonadota bacterium]
MRRRTLLLALCLCTVLSWPSWAQSFEADYRVYWGPLGIADFTLSTSLSETGYTSGLTAKTRGVLGVFFKAKAALETTGQRASETLQAKSFNTDSVFNGDRYARTVAFAPNGTARITGRTVPGDYDIVRTPVSRRDFLGPDPFTFFLDVMQSRGDITGRSFDGVQVVDTTFSCAEGEETLKKKRRRKYTGAAQKCTVEGTVLAGDIIDEPEKNEDDDGRDYVTEIWFARTLVNGLRIPVQVIAEGPRGTVKIYLRGFRARSDKLGLTDLKAPVRQQERDEKKAKAVKRTALALALGD